MKISFIRYKDDTQNFKMAKGMGMDVFEIEEPEKIDDQIEELKNKHYTTIVIPNELASFSERLENNYKYDPRINIIITPSKNV